MADTIADIVYGTYDEVEGNIRVALRGSQRKSLRSMKNASPKMRFNKPCVLLAYLT